MSSSSVTQSDSIPGKNADSDSGKNRGPKKIRIYSHSDLFYWWPVWVVGYIMAAITYLQGNTYLREEVIPVGENSMQIHSSSNLGLIFFVVLFLVILVTNYSVRGLASGIVILGLVLTFVLLLYFDVWDKVFGWFVSQKIFLSLGAYLWISTVMLGMWLIVVFGLDRFSYWEIDPGQLTRDSLFSSGSKSYNTQGMTLEKHQDDLFRHWLLGLGSGDLQVMTSGASREQIDIKNVLFAGHKIVAMQKLIAEVPEE